MLFLCRIKRSCICREKEYADGTQNHAQSRVWVADDIDRIFRKVAIFRDDNLIDVAFFRRENHRSAGICCKRLRGLDFVCQFDFGFFYSLARNLVCDNDCIANRNTFVRIVILKAGGEEKKSKGDKNE